MELTQEHEDEVTNLLTRHTEGLTFDGLYNRGTLFCERSDLSRTLHLLVQHHTIFKRDNMYYLTELAPKVKTSPTVESKPAPVVKVPPPNPKPATPKPQIDTAHKVKPLKETPKVSTMTPAKLKEFKLPSKKPTGKLRRVTLGGIAAMVLWRYRDEGNYLPIERIKDAVGTRAKASNGIYVALSNLIREEYAIKSGNGHGVTYKWSGKFAYPFEQILDSDESLVLVLPKGQRPEGTILGLKSLGVADGVQNNTVAVVETVEKTLPDTSRICTPGDSGLIGVSSGSRFSEPAYLKLLDAAIATHESSLTILKALRESVKL